MEKYGWYEVKVESGEKREEGWRNKIEKTKREGRTYKKTVKNAREGR